MINEFVKTQTNEIIKDDTLTFEDLNKGNTISLITNEENANTFVSQFEKLYNMSKSNH